MVTTMSFLSQHQIQEKLVFQIWQEKAHKLLQKLYQDLSAKFSKNMVTNLLQVS
jgi:hypothetical protein